MAMDDHFEPWRKQGFICKPFAGDRGDGDRFVSEFLDKKFRDIIMDVVY